MSKSGNRIAVPEGTTACASCRTPRGNQRKGWTPITRADTVIGYTCSNCPTASEPIRRIATSTGTVKYRLVVDATPPGAVKRRQITRTMPTLDEARAEVEKIRTEIRTGGEFRPPAAESVEKLMEKWLDTQTGVREDTREGKRAAANAVIRMLGDRDVRTLQPSDVRAFVKELATTGSRPKDRKPRKLGSDSIKKNLAALRGALDLAVEDKIIERNPARVEINKIKAPRQRRRVGKHLEHWETVGRGDEAECPSMDAFREVADKDPWAAAWRFTLIGCRRSETMGARWADLDLDRGQLTISQGRIVLQNGGQRTHVDEPKSEASNRTLPFEAAEPGTVKLLKALRKQQAEDRLAAGEAWEDSGLVFIDELGRGISPERYSDTFRKLCKDARVPVIRLHSARHSLAFLMHARGMLPADAAAWLGHDVFTHERIYLPSGGTTGIAAVGAALGRPKLTAVD